MITHAHIDHYGRLALLVKQGYSGPVYKHNATMDLCEVMLADSAYLHDEGGRVAEQEARRKRARRTTVHPR